MAKKVGGNNRKKGRMKAWCDAYRSRQQRERNKAIKLARHIRACPWDMCAREALERLPASFQKKLNLPDISLSPAAQRKADGITLTSMQRPRAA